MQIPNIVAAHREQKECTNITFRTELKKSVKLSEKYESSIYLKREDQQLIRIFKIRGVYHKFMSLTEEEKKKGVVCPSDGNHAQAVAFFCNYFKVKGKFLQPQNIYNQGTFFIPEVCFSWKVQLVKKYGKHWVEIKNYGNNFLEAQKKSYEFIRETGGTMMHPFEDTTINEGNATMAIEILEDMPGSIDYLIMPIGGGGLAGGVSTYFKAMSPQTKIIGVQPQQANAMVQSIEQGKVVDIGENISRFCDGSAVRTVGQVAFEAVKKNVDHVMTVPDGKVSTTILNLYEQGIAVEPAGALSVSILDTLKNEIKNKRVVCVISGGTVDLSRFDEFKELSLLHEGLKYFYMIQMPFKPQILKTFVGWLVKINNIILLSCLAPDDEISHIQFQRKPNREKGAALVAIEVSKKENIKLIEENMKKMSLQFQNINDTRELYDLLI